MILEYSYEKANEVLKLFKDNKIATLVITFVNDIYVFDYTLVSDYKEKEQRMIQATLANSLSVRINVINALNQFIEKKSLNLINNFSLKFSAVAVKVCNIQFCYSFKDSDKHLQYSLTKELFDCVEKYQSIITQMGVSDQKIPCYVQLDGNGKRKKYKQVTLCEFAEILKQSLKE